MNPGFPQYKHYLEDELKRINGDIFQDLILDFLYFKEYQPVTLDGFVVGANKSSKGTPDIFFTHPEIKGYVFCEITSQKSAIMSKLEGDIKHCFESSIDNSKIGQVILACNSKLSSDKYDILKKKLREYSEDASLIVYNIQNLAFELQYCPFIGKYFKKLDSENILSLDAFIEKSQKGKRPDFNNDFIYNKNIDILYDLLLKNDKVAVYGNQGIGKSRLAVEVAYKFNKENNYYTLIIGGNSDKIIDNIGLLLNRRDNFLIIFDNVDYTFSNIDKIVDFIENYNNKNIKMIFSFRNQFKNNFELRMHNYNIESIEISKMNWKDLRKLILSVFHNNGLNPTEIAVEKIITICNGNPSLALMAILPIIRDQDYSYIENPIKIYEHYFENYKQINEDIENTKILKDMGILSFFGHLEKNNDKLNNLLKDNFSFDLEDEWCVFENLNKEEFVEINSENNIVKISDTILSTYIFYKVFLKKNLLKLSDLLNLFLDTHFMEINNNIVNVTDSLGFSEVKENMIDKTSSFLDFIEEKDNDPLNFYKIFYIFYENKTLKFLKNHIDGLNAEENNLKIDIFKKGVHYHYNEYLELLSKLFILPNTSKKALILAMELIKKQPSKFCEVSRLINNKFSFNSRSNDCKFENQFLLINFLNEHFKKDDYKNIAEKLFLSYVGHIHIFKHEQVEERPVHMGIHLINFGLKHSNELKELRKLCLKTLFSLYDIYVGEVSSILEDYCSSIYRETKDLIDEEQKLMLNFFKCQDMNKIIPNIIYLKYIKALEKNEIEIINEINELKKNNVILNILNNYTSLGSWDKYEIEDKISKDLKDKSFDYIKNILIILKDLLNEYDLKLNRTYVTFMFECLINKDLNLFFKVFKYYLKENFNFGISQIIHFILTNELLNPIEIYNIINNYEFDEKQEFLASFFCFITEEYVEESIFLNFIDYINSTNVILDINMWNKYLKYNSLFLKFKDKIVCNDSESNIIQYITRKFIDSNQKIRVSIEYGEEKFKDYFEDNIELLKELYLFSYNADDYDDYKLHNLTILCSMNKSTIFDFLYCIYSKKENEFKNIDFRFIWNIYSIDELDNIVDMFMELGFMIPISDPDNLNEDKYIKHVIKNGNMRKIRLVLGEILDVYGRNNFINYLKFFLKNNDSFEDFESIRFNRMGLMSDFRSALEEDINFLIKIKKMIESFNNLNYIDHIDFIENHINSIKETIKEMDAVTFKKSSYYN